MELVAVHLNDVLILCVFAVSFNLLAGYAGQLSVAHAAFGAVGGYTLAYLYLNDGFSFALGAVIGVAFAVIAGALVGASVVRLSSEWLMLLTFAVQIVVTSVATGWSRLGGTYGLQNVAGLELFGQRLDKATTVLPVFAVFTLAVYAVCYRLGESAYGRVLRGIREDAVASRSLGKNVPRYKLTVFALTAGMAGLAGTMLVVQNALASPEMFDLPLATVIVASVVIGGRGNLLGSVLGAALISLSTPFLHDVVRLSATTASLWQLVIYGSVLVLVLLVRPQGIIPEGISLRGRSGRRVPSPFMPIPPQPLQPREHRQKTSGREPALEVTGLCKRFGGVVAVDGLDLSLPRGSISALVGPNGAGKTTVFNLLTGVVAPDRGSVCLKGREVVGRSPDQIARLGMVRSFQDVRIFPRLSVLDNVMLGVQGNSGERALQLFLRPQRTRRDERRARRAAIRWLDFIGLRALVDARAGDLAFGEQKLVALARALATDAAVLLLDEPASGVDAYWVDPILELIQRARAEGRTICIVEHNLEIVERVADEILFMELGRIIAQGSFAELTSQPRLAEVYFGA